jgi:hypothetical protein
MYPLYDLRVFNFLFNRQKTKQGINTYDADLLGKT